ncbi:secreted RxLR effector protein 161-like [Quercus suber]|uniref:secreted RxLR effector protein 161-like n=1 Tax=Quercus suber TaxID=58331 RepID=UPI0032DF0344
MHGSTPMNSFTKLSLDSSGIEVSPTLYRSIIRSLPYLTASKPDIVFIVGVCAHYQAAPKESHLTVVKRIICYINSTPEYGLWYSKDSNDCLVGYLDANWVGSVDDRKSTSDGCFYLRNNLLSWMSKKQNSVSLSTAKSKYIAARSCCTQLLWMKKLLHDYGIPQETMSVFCDNTSAINLSKNPVQHSKSKHIEICYHFIRDLVEDKIVCLEFIHTDNQKVDIFTKPLDGPWFESLRKTIGVSIIP